MGCASATGHATLVHELLAHGADVDYFIDAIWNDDYRKTALRFAIENDHTRVVELLLVNGADANFHSSIGASLLYYALDDGRYDSVKALLAHGAVGSDNDDGPSNLEHAMELPPDCPSRTLIVKALLPRLPDVPSIPVFWHRSKDEMCYAPLPETEDETEWREVARIMVYEETLPPSILTNDGKDRMK